MSNNRSLWPDTALSHAFLIALAQWAIAHHEAADARITLPVGVVDAVELLKVMRALERARQQTVMFHRSPTT
jgi:hypothetical protein